MAMEDIKALMDISMKGNGRTTYLMEWARLYIQMDQSIVDNFWMEKNMVKEFSLQKKAHTKEPLRMIRLMDFVYSKATINKDMKDNGKIA